VRDLDVMLIALPELASDIPAALAAELEPLAAMLEAFHARERTRLLRFLEAPARLRGVARFEAFVERGLGARPRGDGARPLGAVAPALLESAAARVWKRGDKIGKHAPPADLHRLRIAIKRLRYTAEMLAPVYADALDGWLQRTTELQDVLGTFNDSGVAGAHLSGWIDTREGRRLPRRTLVAAGALLAHYEQRAQEARKGFRKAWRRFAKPKARRELQEIARAVAGQGPA
jgi:CHAD domain-containing protein